MKTVLGVEVRPSVERQRVLDIPAIDMTEKEAVVARPGAGAGKSRRRDGSIGRETFERVEALLKEGRNKKQAFSQVAAETGKNSGTVSANYYRVARATDAVKPRGRRAAAAPAHDTKRREPAKAKVRPTVRSSATRRVRAQRGDDGSIDSVAASLVSNIEALAALVRAQEAELSDLRGRLEVVRGLLS